MSTNVLTNKGYVDGLSRAHTGMTMKDALTTLDEKSDHLHEEIKKLQDDIIDLILINGVNEASSVSPYSMSYEEYMELPGDIRL